MNNALRLEYTLDEIKVKMVKALDETLSYTKLDNSIVVYRIVDLDDYPEPSKGTDITDKAYLSTSVDISYLLENLENYEDPLIIKINIPSNTNYIKFPNDFESELVFPRGSTLKYTTNLVKMNSNYKEIDAELVRQ